MFGPHGVANFGNDAVLRAFHHHIGRVAPNSEFMGICIGPSAVAAEYGIPAVPCRLALVPRWDPQGRLARAVRRALVAAPGELYQWFFSLKTMRRVDALVVPGTGLLQDADTFLGWGPYDMFRWAVCAKLCGRKLLFVSVGAGPLYSRAGRFFVKTALRLADYRSYRDESTRQCLEAVWTAAGLDPVYPDLVFSLPTIIGQDQQEPPMARPLVGLGLKGDSGRYGSNQLPGHHLAYLQAMAGLAHWLLAHGYAVRLLIGDANSDRNVLQEFSEVLDTFSAASHVGQVVDAPVSSLDQLLGEIAATDYMVGTRFHNVLLAMLLGKPVIAVSFHPKCKSLMDEMGQSDYTEDMMTVEADSLVTRFLQLQQNADRVKVEIQEGLDRSADALDDQYAVLLRVLGLGRPHVGEVKAFQPTK